MVTRDKLSSHRVESVHEAIEGQGAQLLYPPPYSSEVSSIAIAFSKLKRLLKSLVWLCLVRFIW